jgi:glycerol kinase
MLLALDQGTTSTRAIRFDAALRPQATAQRELTQHFPSPGWVEHEPEDLIADSIAMLREAAGDERITAIGITNQRETTLLWRRDTGQAVHRAIVWQDRRTAEFCAGLPEALITERTGLLPDPYFSASKLAWLLEHVPGARRDAEAGRLCFGTVDSFLLFRLTGMHATDATNASRTMLFDITTMQWSSELCSMFGVPMHALPTVVASSGRAGATAASPGIPAGIPISGIAGDQQAALFGQACFETGSSKNTYGTGSFVLMNVGTTCPQPTEGMLTTVAWDLGTGETTYALEGAIFVTGSAIQWLRDGINIIDHASQIGPLAESVPNTGGVVVVPAFTGLGSPWWDPYARGAILGITRGTTSANIARAVV